LAPHFIGTDGPTMSFTGSGKFTSGPCVCSPNIAIFSKVTCRTQAINSMFFLVATGL